ncbi:MAG: hypothetical protein RBG13Loki_1016 [Promethearchaeota archaeon CR_4]|nr:MAG: hypothetical protein RBG13Loki_1016 [Candidatus Lokiarchaeota archaeon CR_4]
MVSTGFYAHRHLGFGFYYILKEWCKIGNFLEAFGVVKSTELVCYRYEDKLIHRLALGENYFEIISMLLGAVPTFIENTLGSRLISIAFIESFEKQNPRLFELPSSPQMTPLGFGTAFRLASIPDAPDLLSFSIERVLLKNDDFLLPGDQSVRKLLSAFYQENTPAFLNFQGNVEDLMIGIRRGRFNDLFLKSTKEERRGDSKYTCIPLMVYGHCSTLLGEKANFGGKMFGYDLKPRFFEKYFPPESTRRDLFDIIELLKNIKKGVYAKLTTPLNPDISLIAFMRENKTFLLAEFSPTNPDSPETIGSDFLGFLLQLNPRKTGHNLAKILYKVIFNLRESFTKFQEDVPVSYIDAFIAKEFTSLSYTPSE